MPKVTIEITDILEKGTCPAGHKIGEVFKYSEDVGKICPAALNSIYPIIQVLEAGGYYSYFDEPDAHSACCPDYKNPVVFKMSR